MIIKMASGKLYEIICKRGFDRETCKFMKQDKELQCSICSFAAFKERIKRPKENKPEEDGQVQSDFQQ